MKIYCLVPSQPITDLGKAVGISHPVIAANTIGAWQSKNNKPGVMPEVSELQKYMEETEEERKTLAYALPMFEMAENAVNFFSLRPDGTVILGRLTERLRDGMRNDLVQLGVEDDLAELKDDRAKYIYLLYMAKDRFQFGATKDKEIRLNMHKRAMAKTRWYKEHNPELFVAEQKPTFSGKMTFEFGQESAPGVTSKTTIEAIKKGERTATTRYAEDGNIDYWSQAKVGDVIEFTGKNGEKVLVRVTKPLTLLPKSTTAEEWSKKEGWSVDRFNNKVKQRIENQTAYQMEFEYVGESTSEQAQQQAPQSAPSRLPIEAANHFTPVRTSKYSKLAKTFTPQQLKARYERLAREFSERISERLYSLAAEQEEIIATGNMEEAMKANAKLRELQDPVEGRRRALESFSEDNRNGFQAIYEGMKQDYMDMLEYYREEGFDPEMIQAYQDIIDNFDALFENACVIIEEIENLRIDLHDVKDVNGKPTAEGFLAAINDSLQTQKREEEEFGDDEGGTRATGNDGWSFQIRFVDPYQTVTAKTKAALLDVKMVDSTGEPIVDDMGNQRYYSAAFVHGVLLSFLSNMTHPNDFCIEVDGKKRFPALEAIKDKYPWVDQLIDKLTVDDDLVSTFYGDLRKDRTDFWKHKIKEVRDEETGEIHYVWQTMSINQGVGGESAATEAMSNFDSGNILSPLSIYTSTGNLNIENIEELQKIVSDILYEKEEAQDEDEILAVAEKLANVIRAFGINTNTSFAATLLDENLDSLVGKMQLILDEALKLEEGEHLVTTLYREFSKLGESINSITEDIPPMTTREGERSLPTYAAPNYIDTILKRIKNDATRQELLESEFKRFSFFYDAKKGEWKNGWLEILEENREARAQLAIMSLDNIDGLTYDKWKPSDIKTAFFRQYLAAQSEKFAWYNTPIYSDSTTANFIKMVRYRSDSFLSFKDKLLPRFNALIHQELYRMSVIEKRAEAGAEEIQNFDSHKEEFLFFPRMNDYTTADGVKLIDAIKQAKKDNNPERIDELINKAIEDIMNEDFELFISRHMYSYSFEGVSMQSVAEEYYPGISDHSDSLRNLYEEYFWNQAYATSQIIEITVTDPAFFKGNDGVDFQKRFKQVLAAGRKLNTNSKYGKTHELTIYLADSIRTSNSYQQIQKNIGNAVKAGRMTDTEAEFILGEMVRVNATDAQAYRNLSSMRTLLDMMGEWNSHMEEVMQRFKDGTYTSEDFDCVWQTVKPFVFANIAKPDGLGGWMRVPHQNKNSEFLTLALYDLMSMTQERSAKMRAVDRFMEDNGIDVVQFASAVKCGGQGIIDIDSSPTSVKAMLLLKDTNINNVRSLRREIERIKKDNPDVAKVYQDLIDRGLDHAIDFFEVKKKLKNPGEIKDFRGIKAAMDKLLQKQKITQEQYSKFVEVFEPTETEVYEMLNAATKTGSIIEQDKNAPDFGFNKEVVHAIPYDNYVVQQPTPEHLFDTTAVLGSQFKNLITADLPADIVVTLPNGAKIEGRQNVVRVFQGLMVENLLDDYQKVSKKFESIENLRDAILEVVKGNPKYGREFLEAMEIIEVDYNGSKIKTFNLPMNTPTITAKLQEIVNSMFKNAIAKQKIKGGNAILVSNFGFSENLKVVRDEETGALVEVQCMLPWHSAQHFKQFIKREYDSDGNIIKEEIDIKKVEKATPELLEMIGYRIPTEGKYSMLPLKVVGFLPQQNGSSMMLPAEITTIAGSDFDVDKVFLMMPEFNVFTHNKRKALRDYKNLFKGDFFAAIKDKIEIEDDSLLSKELSSFSELMELSDEEIEAINIKDKEFNEWFEENKDAYEYKDKNGEAVPRIEKVRYNTTDASKLSRRKRNTMIVDISRSILQNPVISEHFNSPGNFNTIKVRARKSEIMRDFDMASYLYTKSAEEGIPMTQILDNMSLKELDKFISEHKRKRSLVSPETFAYFHEQNMVGKALVGMYANNTTIQAKMQNVKGLRISETGEVVMNGRTIDSLNSSEVEINGRKMRVSKNCSEFSAASVDNAKDPVLASLRQSIETASVTSAMLRMAMEIDEIGAMFTNPITEYLDNNIWLTDVVAPFMAIVDEVALALGEEWQKISSNHSTKSVDEATIGFTMLTEGKHIGIGINSILKEFDRYNEDRMQSADRGSENVDIRNYPTLIMAAVLTNDAMIYKHIKDDIAKPLKDAVSVQRADSPNGAIQNTVAKAVIQQQKVRRIVLREKVQERIYQENGPMPPVFHLTESIPLNDIVRRKSTRDQMREAFMSRDIPTLQASYTLGIDFALQSIAEYYTPLSPSGQIAIDRMFINARDMRIKEKTVEKFLFNFSTFMLSKTKMFGNDGTTTFKEKRDYYLNEYPAKFEALKLAHPELNSLGVIKALSVNKNGDIVLRGSSRKSKTARQMLMADFDMLLESESPIAIQLATDLLAYSYYKDGLSFGANSFGTLFSPAFLNNFPEIMEVLRLGDKYLDTAGAFNYYYQFMLQNYKDILPRKVVKIPGTDQLDFSDVITLSYGESINDFENMKYPFLNINGILYRHRDNVILPKGAAEYEKVGKLEAQTLVLDANSNYAGILNDYKHEKPKNDDNDPFSDFGDDFADFDGDRIDDMIAQMEDALDGAVDQTITDNEVKKKEQSRTGTPSEVEVKYDSKEGLKKAGENPC